MRRVTIEEFQTELMVQGVPSREDLAVRCPMCGTVQSARDFIAAGAGNTFEEVERYLAFSCIGRFTGQKLTAKTKPGLGCDWSLGGLLTTHKLEVVDEDGNAHPRFEPATPFEAQAHYASKQTRAP